MDKATIKNTALTTDTPVSIPIRTDYGSVLNRSATAEGGIEVKLPANSYYHQTYPIYNPKVTRENALMAMLKVFEGIYRNNETEKTRALYLSFLEFYAEKMEEANEQKEKDDRDKI